MKKMILLAILVSVITSLSCLADEEFDEGFFRYRVTGGNTVSLIGYHIFTDEDGQFIYPGQSIELDSVCTDGQGRKYILTAVESGEGAGYKTGLCAMYSTETMILPFTVKHIGEKALRINWWLSTLKMPGVQTIGAWALEEADINTSLELRNVEIIETSAFDGCSNLPEICFGEKLRFIGRYAFEGCKYLNNVDVGNPKTWSKVHFDTKSSNPITISRRFSVYGVEVKHLDIDMRRESVSQWAFVNAGNLRSVRIRNAVSINSWAFDDCYNLSDLCLDVEMIGDYAFDNISTLRRIYVTTPKPPRAYSNVFSNYENVTLYVPKGCIEAYRNSDSCWRLFKDIQECDFSEIDDIFKADYDTENPASVESVEREEREEGNDIDHTKPLEVYTMQGQLISRSAEGLQPGLYILRQGRKAKKVLVGKP